MKASWAREDPLLLLQPPQTHRVKSLPTEKASELAATLELFFHLCSLDLVVDAAVRAKEGGEGGTEVGQVVSDCCHVYL